MAGKPGRPCWLPSDSDCEKIQTMAAVGIPQEKIALVFNVAEKTLRRHCRIELDTGEALANSEVGRFLFDAATGRERYRKEDGSVGLHEIGVTSATVTAAIFWMKTRANWKELFQHGGNGPEGSIPIVLYESDKRL